MDFQAVFTVCLGLTMISQALSYCKFSNVNHPGIRRLEALNGSRFSVSDKKDSGYSYQIGICVPANPSVLESTDAGVFQVKDPKPGDTPVPVIVGSIHDARIEAGTDWIFLEYRGGKKYKSHCGNESRRAHIMITCLVGEKQGKLRVIEENNQRYTDCYYLFELDHDAACPPKQHGLSVGSVVCIVFFVVVAVYLLAGAAYQRFIVGAKGMEQIPNYTFWQDFGNLQADGCDFLCRRHGRNSGSREYRGIGDDQLNTDQDDDVGRDDSLLPM